jgi:two-component sensor histidine kinase
LYPDLGSDGVVRGYFSAVLDITAAKVTQDSQLRREHMLRSALVREINHRIKNSLQGLIGMMRLSSAREVSSAAAIDQCVSQLMAVAVAFGLASRHGEAQILLCDMVLDIAHNVEQVSQRRIQVELSPAAVRQPVALSERHGANISLVINELIFNAIKHSAGIDGPRGIKVLVDRDESSATFSVSNEAGRLPKGFSMADGSGLGTGLSLIKVLVPAESCDLVIEPGSPGVSARLTLRAPVLSLS